MELRPRDREKQRRSSPRRVLRGFLVDTNNISEFARLPPDLNVSRWLRDSDPSDLFVSVITFGEPRIGIENLAPGKRRNELEQWLETGLPNWFAANLLPVSQEIAEDWAHLTILAKRKGMLASAPDALIAATASVHQLTLVTRNTSDFTAFSIALLNPWTP